MDFERKKKDLTPHDSSTINLNIPYSMANSYDEAAGKRGTFDCDLARRCPQHDVTYAPNNTLVITNSAAKQLFDPVIEEMVSTLHDVLAQPTVQGCKYVILVGGFSDNKLVQNRIKNNFTHHDCTVLVPNDAQMSVLIGAVRFGQRPRDVTSRIARVHVLQRHGGAVSEGLP